MTQYVVQRLILAGPVLLGVSIAVFLMMHLLPGDRLAFTALHVCPLSSFYSVVVAEPDGAYNMLRSGHDIHVEQP